MPISLPEGLPARRILAEEGIEFFTSSDAARWSTRPLRIAVLNLMPDKQATELQLARLLGSTPTPVELCLLTTESYTPTNTSAEHLDAHYRMWKTSVTKASTA